jgi:glycosyltransferase involved in cell wall biosynthesis
MSNKENVLILFDASHLAYSPTTLQLHAELSKQYDVTITALHPDGYTGQEANIENILYHKCYGVKGRYFYWIFFMLWLPFSKDARVFKKNKLTYKDYFFKFLFIKKTIRSKKFKRIIAVDNSYLFFCSLLKTRVDFLSLELTVNDNLIQLVDRDIINCIIIQSKERYDHLFKQETIKTFYVQNAPVYNSNILKSTRKPSLIYGGSTIKILGFYHCLAYLNKYTDETMSVQGAFFEDDKKRVNAEYDNLLKEGRLLINSEYLDNDDVVGYLSNYEIGFCFYYFEDAFMQKHYFNYMSAPSGKMFKYLAAGVPVVCSNISGFQFVKEFQCGVLIDTLDEDTIRNAIQTIRKDYDFYVQNTIKAAEFYSFDKAIAPYIDFIK